MMKRKVYTYITHRQQLLVFRHRDFPEAGIQVPGGTVEPEEDTAVAALREAYEETGLNGLELVRKLGEDTLSLVRYGRDEMVHRTFYHLRTSQPPPTRWDHAETNPAEGDANIIWFKFFWAVLPEGVPALAGNLDAFLEELKIDACQ